MNRSMILGMALSAAMIPAQIAYAQNTTTLAIIQGFGCCHVEGSFKALVQSNSGKRYFVWYDTQLEVPIGETLVLTYDQYSNTWYKLTNPTNGREADVSKYLQVQP